MILLAIYILWEVFAQLLLHSYFQVNKIKKFFKLGLLYVKSNDYPIRHPKNVATIIIVSLLCLIGFTSGIITIRDMINGK